MSKDVTIHMSFADYVEANRLRVRWKWTFVRTIRFLAMTGLLFAAIFALGEISKDGVSIVTVLTGLIMGLIWAIGVYLILRLWLLWCIPRAARKLYAQQPSASAPFQFGFTAVGITSNGPFETAALPWSHIHGWIENERLLLLSRTSLTFFCLPKAQLGEANVIALKQFLAAAGVKQGV